MPLTPSSVVVTDSVSMAQNFAQNSQRVLCDAAFGAGAYAIGGSLLGVVSLTGPQALVTTGALLAALTLCPSGADSSQILGVPPDLVGGQCPVQYKLTLKYAEYNSGGGFSSNSSYDVFGLGPLRIVDTTAKAFKTPADPNSKIIVFDGNNQQVYSRTSFYGISPGSPFKKVVRLDGAPDDCGNQGGRAGQIITNNQTGDTINGNKVVDNSKKTTVIPVFVNVGGINGSLNMNFGPIEIESLLPLNFNIDIGGVNFGFGQKPDGSLEPRSRNPDKSAPDNRGEAIQKELLDLLKEIKKCVCKPDVDLDLLQIPYVDNALSCDIRGLDMLVPKGSVGISQTMRLQRSAEAALLYCRSQEFKQQPEALITAATITQDGREFFSPKIDAKIISVRIKITSFKAELLPKITSYPAANQRKFGSVSYTLDSYSGGGDYIYVFDADTYFPLPDRAKDGVIRVLFKPGTSFEIYDTGERLKER